MKTYIRVYDSVFQAKMAEADDKADDNEDDEDKEDENSSSDNLDSEGGQRFRR